ncbi:sensor histidine kinase [Lachnospiraceae bacterium KM106-2]|nr:sensor histidine kinase [Lachnospiraceae bacterium KM106-2]
MRLVEYLKDKALVLLLHITGMLFLSLYLLMTGYAKDNITLILLMWGTIVGSYYSIDFIKRRRYFKDIEQLLDELDQRYLIGEVMRPSARLEDKLYREILRKSNKSVIERINELEQAQVEYKEYIESWIHDVKSPVAAIELICENHRDENMNNVRMEIGKIENQVDMILYYARLEKAYQDYMIHPVDLREAVLTSIHQNKPYFIQNQMSIHLDLESVVVSTDEKWVEFLLNQIFSNCMKYKNEKEAMVHISARRGKKSVSLVIEDNGIGIVKEDLRRIFQKGFTGKNGRTGEKATGIGLYLCKRLCDKLGIGIHCESEYGSYTRMILTFPDTDYSKVLQK